MADCMAKFVEEYDGRGVEDDGAYMSPEAKACLGRLKRCLKADLARMGVTLESFRIGHYDASGFAEKGGKYAYFSWSLPRGEWPIDCGARDPMNGVLCRTAEGPKDFTGGANRFASLENASMAIASLLA